MPLMRNPDVFDDGTTTPIRLSCPSCGAGPNDKHRVDPDTMPDIESAAEMMDAVMPATDGCMVEPDGRCEHGHRSWLLYWGMI